MFEIGDIITNKHKRADPTFIPYAIIVYMEHNPPRPFSHIKLKGLNFNWDENTKITYHEVQMWWNKV